MSRYYCIIRLDSNPEISSKAHKELNEKLSTVIQEWADEQARSGNTVDIGWNWSEHINLY